MISDQRYGIADEIEESTPRKTKDERRYKLSQVVPSENFQFVYCYDFGDNWEHDLLVEKILPSQQGVRYPVCIDGARACPPEDVGGIGGYEEFLEAINDPNHPSHTEFWEWLGRKFDPEHFDMEMTNRLLR